MSASDYTALITSEHADKPRFVATVAASVQPFSDMADQARALAGEFDLDQAVGVQLDAVGAWVGQSRYLSVPLTGVYFSFDDASLGFDEGTWQGPFDPDSGISVLPDDIYRQLLRAVIAANYWDGTIPGAYRIWGVVYPLQDASFYGSGPVSFVGPDGTAIFSSYVSNIVIQDNGDMTMYIGLIYENLSAVMRSILVNGYIRLKPAGVRVSYLAQSVQNAPLFGFDVANSSVAGFDSGGWATVLSEA